MIDLILLVLIISSLFTPALVSLIPRAVLLSHPSSTVVAPPAWAGQHGPVLLIQLLTTACTIIRAGTIFIMTMISHLKSP